MHIVNIIKTPGSFTGLMKVVFVPPVFAKYNGNILIYFTLNSNKTFKGPVAQIKLLRLKVTFW